MRSFRKPVGFASILFCTALAGSAQHSADSSHGSNAAQSRIAFTHTLPGLDGSHLSASVVEVTYQPGGFSAPHSHSCPVIGYVLEGALRMQVNHDPEVVYKAGESFYEAANSAHMISANASDRVPVKFLAYFVCDHKAPLSVVLSTPEKSGAR